MRIAIMQPYLFPYIGYFQLINAVDIFVIFDDVSYIKKGWINRNRVLVKNRPFLFTMPIEKASQNRLISETRISPDFNTWRTKFFELLRHSYHRAPFYSECMGFIKQLLEPDDYRLGIFLGLQIRRLSRYLGIETEFVFSSEIEKNNDLRGQDKIIDICRQLDAEVYINPVGGKALYRGDDFLRNGIELLFLESKPVRYKQFNQDFVPDLSIIDVLMFNALDRVNQFLHEYELSRAE